MTVAAPDPGVMEQRTHTIPIVSGWRRSSSDWWPSRLLRSAAVWVLLLAPFRVMPEAEAAQASGGGVVVESSTDLTFTPGISRQEQTRQVVEATVALLAGADQ